MKFEAIPVDQAVGYILGHNITNAQGRRALRKGKLLTTADIILLKNLGRKKVYTAIPETDDIDENSSAARIAKAVAGESIRLSKATTGRVNLFTQSMGILRVDVARLLTINSFEGVTLATLANNSPTVAGNMVATLKIIPYTLPSSVVQGAESVGHDQPLITLTPITPKSVSLLLSGSATSEERVRRGFQSSLSNRLDRFKATLTGIEFIPLEDESGEIALAAAISYQHAAGNDIVILAGETAIMDRFDIAPRAVERAGGRVTCFGAPVDPGNLLMLGYLDDMPIVGAPGCVRSPKTNIIDLILPRLLAGDRLTESQIIAWGHGGLLEDVPERPLPRSNLL